MVTDIFQTFISLVINRAILICTRTSATHYTHCLSTYSLRINTVLPASIRIHKRVSYHIKQGYWIYGDGDVCTEHSVGAIFLFFLWGRGEGGSCPFPPPIKSTFYIVRSPSEKTRQFVRGLIGDDAREVEERSCSSACLSISTFNGTLYHEKNIYIYIKRERR